MKALFAMKQESIFEGPGIFANSRNKAHASNYIDYIIIRVLDVLQNGYRAPTTFQVKAPDFKFELDEPDLGHLNYVQRHNKASWSQILKPF